MATTLGCNPKIKFKFNFCRLGHPSTWVSTEQPGRVTNRENIWSKKCIFKDALTLSWLHLPADWVAQQQEKNFLLESFYWIPSHTFPLDLGQPQHFSNSSQVCQNLSLKKGSMENILCANIVKWKRFQSGLFYLKGCHGLISQIKPKLKKLKLRTLKAWNHHNPD